MKILIISNAFPYPPNTGEKTRNYNLIKRMSLKHKIFIISLIQSGFEDVFVNEMKEFCSGIEIVSLKRQSKLKHLPGVLRCLLSGQPLANKFVFLREMKEKIKKTVTENNFDIIQFEHFLMAPYINIIPKSNRSKKILTLHNVGTVQFRRMFKTEKNSFRKVRLFLNWVPLRYWEPKIAMKFDRCVVTSRVDKLFLESLNPKLDISVILNGVDTKKYKMLSNKPNAKNFLFIGKMDYRPNIDAALYFYKEIFPIIKKQIPDCKFLVVGSNPPEEIVRLTKDANVIVTGYVHDVKSYYEQCAVAVVPLRAGGGTRLKILEAMAFGRPVVSTSIGCEGLEVAHRENILVADKPEDFARYVSGLLTDIKLRQRISSKARKFVEVNYSWNKIAKDLMHIYEKMVTSRKEELRQ